MAQDIIITGTITCDPDDLDLLLAALPEHVALSRAELGCLAFTIEQSSDDPLIFNVGERFCDRAAFDAHGARSRDSAWWEKTRHIPRDLTVTEA